MPVTSAVSPVGDSITMINSRKNFFSVLLTALCLHVLFSCGSDEEPYPRMPFVDVFLEIYLNDPILQADLNDPTKRYIYLNEGVNGIILHKTIDDRYIALERLSPVSIEDDCTVNVDNSGFFIDDPCSEAIWDMEGNPSGGGNAWPLYQYPTLLTGQNGDYLLITN